MDLLTQYFEILIMMSIQAAVLIALILIIRWALATCLHPGWSYLLWIIVMLRLVLPGEIEIELPTQIHSLHPARLSPEYIVHRPAETVVTSQTVQYTAANQAMINTTKQTGININSITIALISIWLMGFVYFVARYWCNLRYTQRLIHNCRTLTDPQATDLFKHCKALTKLNRPVSLKVCPQITSPASFGILQPVILLPRSASNLSSEELKLIFLHELLHHKHSDLLADRIMHIAKALHWFNPAIWVAHHAMRSDCETSCDQRVLRISGKKYAHTYGKLLIQFASFSANSNRSGITYAMSGKSRNIEQRIKLVLDKPKHSVFSTLSAASLFLLVSAMALTAPAYSPVPAAQIIFDHSISESKSGFSKQRLTTQSLTRTINNKRITGLLTQPSSQGRHPAIVLTHGCEGFGHYHEYWADFLTQLGYVTLRLTQQELQTPYCDKPITQINTRVVSQVMDAYAAIEYLSTLSFVDPSDISLISWESWAAIGAAAKYGVGQVYQKKFKRAIAMYPDCTATYNGDFTTPLLIIVGELDDWAGPSGCMAIQHSAMKNGNHKLDLIMYKHTYHGFDNDNNYRTTFLPYAKNLSNLPGKGALAQYNRSAYLDARKRIISFLKNSP